VVARRRDSRGGGGGGPAAGRGAARRAGHEVVEVGHEPRNHHDWWTGSFNAKEAIRAASVGADYLLAADYPFAPLRVLLPSSTEIVSLRHSLASRGNTYEPEQFDADHIAAFSEFDVGRLASAWGRLPKRRPIQFATAGCPWAAPVLSPDRAGARAALLDRVGLRHDDSRPVVAVATTWNPWTSLDAVRELAADRERIVIWRPHWAAAWRRPGELDEVRSFGAFVDDPLEHPSALLLGSDVLVGDVSGIVLLATLVRGPNDPTVIGPLGGLPVVMIDPDPSALLGSGQLDPTGPEWEFRDRIGPRLPPRRAPGEVVEAVSRLLANDDEWRGSRAGVGEAMSAPYTTPDSPERLIEALTR
jgi:hypothetical protein